MKELITNPALYENLAADFIRLSAYKAALQVGKVPVSPREAPFEAAIQDKVRKMDERQRAVFLASLEKQWFRGDARTARETAEKWKLDLDSKEALQLQFDRLYAAYLRKADKKAYRNYAMKKKFFEHHGGRREDFAGPQDASSDNNMWEATAPLPPIDTRNFRLLCKLLHVTAVDETDPEPLGADEIFLNVNFTDLELNQLGTQSFKVGDFEEDGDIIGFLPQKVLLDVPIDHTKGFPQEFFGSFTLVEEDSEDAKEVMSDIADAFYSMAGVSGGAGTGSLGADGSGYLILAGFVLAILGGILDAIASAFEDDIFPPFVESMIIPSMEALSRKNTVAGKTFGMLSFRSVPVKAHGGTYRIDYYWQVVSTEHTDADFFPI